MAFLPIEADKRLKRAVQPSTAPAWLPRAEPGRVGLHMTCKKQPHSWCPGLMLYWEGKIPADTSSRLSSLSILPSFLLRLFFGETSNDGDGLAPVYEETT